MQKRQIKLVILIFFVVFLSQSKVTSGKTYSFLTNLDENVPTSIVLNPNQENASVEINFVATDNTMVECYFVVGELQNISPILSDHNYLGSYLFSEETFFMNETIIIHFDVIEECRLVLISDSHAKFYFIVTELSGILSSDPYIQSGGFLSLTTSEESPEGIPSVISMIVFITIMVIAFILIVFVLRKNSSRKFSQISVIAKTPGYENIDGIPSKKARQSMFCPSCGESIDFEDQFCKNCGSNI